MKPTVTFAPFLALVALTGLLSISASAGAQNFEFEAGGVVRHVGLSTDPSKPTTVTSKFKLDADSSGGEVKIRTSNELVIGTINEIGTCSGSGCEQLGAALSDSPFFSLHESAVKLEVEDLNNQWLNLQAPLGQIPLFVQTLSGTLGGKLDGEVAIGNGADSIIGRTSLQIEGTGSYVCFSPYLEALGISESLPGPLFPCQEGEGQLLPVELNVVDSGSIVAKGAIGTEGENVKFKAALVVEVRSAVDLNLLLAGDPAAYSTSGSLTITDGEGAIK